MNRLWDIIEWCDDYILSGFAKIRRIRKKRPFTFAVLLIGLVALFGYMAFIRAPSQFPLGNVVSIPEGMTLQEAAISFENNNVIRSAFWLRASVIALRGERSIVAGEYFFAHPANVYTVAKMITQGDFGLSPIKVTVPEGSSVVDIAIIFSEQFNTFDPLRFLELAESKEGYLFPDTYYFLPTVNETKVITVLERTFEEKLEALETQIEKSDRSFEEIVTMASIIEREAHTSQSRRIISGILWKRVDIGMPLQVDVTFDYINGKNTFDLTLEDLEIDSPYNTYKYAGLPPGPIGSPSIDSLEAALNPEESEYLYFLADKSGEVHYSSTFEEHKEKKRIYLN